MPREVVREQGSNHLELYCRRICSTASPRCVEKVRRPSRRTRHRGDREEPRGSSRYRKFEADKDHTMVL